VPGREFIPFSIRNPPSSVAASPLCGYRVSAVKLAVLFWLRRFGFAFKTNAIPATTSILQPRSFVLGRDLPRGVLAAFPLKSDISNLQFPCARPDRPFAICDFLFSIQRQGIHAKVSSAFIVALVGMLNPDH
jgi:hypothetical protein